MASCYPRIGGIVYSATQAYLILLWCIRRQQLKHVSLRGVETNSDMLDAQKWYPVVGGQSNLPQYYTYSATNLRLQRKRPSDTLFLKVNFGELQM